jgi:hypothetical protein
MAKDHDQDREHICQSSTSQQLPLAIAIFLSYVLDIIVPISGHQRLNLPIVNFEIKPDKSLIQFLVGLAFGSGRSLV